MAPSRINLALSLPVAKHRVCVKPETLGSSDYDQEHTIANLPYARATHLTSPRSPEGLSGYGTVP